MKRILFHLLFLLLPVWTLAAQDMTAAAEAPVNLPPRQDGLSVGMSQHGMASFYADKFHGRLTASGERFDMYAMTAAHKTLPFGTVITVTNVSNGKKVQLRVNDRGPFIAGRIVDVSKQAAKRLAMLGAGVVSAKVVIVSLPPKRPLASKKSVETQPLAATPVMSSKNLFTIQIASYSQRQHAEQYRERLQNMGIPAHLQQHGKYYRLTLVNLNKKQVQSYRRQLARLGISDILLRRE